LKPLKKAHFGAAKHLLGTLLCVLAANAFGASLMSHFHGRYGAIEIFDTQKKLSFRVNAPELSQPRDFCQFNDLSIAIAAVDTGVLADFDAPLDALLPAKSAPSSTPNKPAAVLTLKRALRLGNAEVFAVLRSKIMPAKLAALEAKSALPTKTALTSAFALLDWFKALHAGTLALQPKTKLALNTLLTVRRDRERRFFAFSSRCAADPGALAASVGMITSKTAPVFFALSVDGKSRAELFQVAPKIRDAALAEMGYWGVAAP
jgi:hypothetical protein